MPIKNILLSEFNFIYTKFSGVIDDLQILSYPDQVKKCLVGLKHYCEIIDLSGNPDFSQLNSMTLTRVGKLEKERPLAGTGPLAIHVSNPLTYGLARAYSTFIEDARTDLLISYSLEECLDFMGFSDHHKQLVSSAILRNDVNDTSTLVNPSVSFNFPLDN